MFGWAVNWPLSNFIILKLLCSFGVSDNDILSYVDSMTKSILWKDFKEKYGDRIVFPKKS